MTTPSLQSKPAAETHLQRTLNSALNEVAADSALAAIFHQENGPLVEHASRGFSPREAQAILRTLSTQTAALAPSPQDPEGGRTIRLRLITPGAKSLLSIPLRHLNRVYGHLVIGRKEGATFAKKEKSFLDQAGEGITKALDREGLFNTSAVMSRPYVTQEPLAAQQSGADMFPALTTHFSPELRGKIEAILIEANQFVAYDRAYLTKQAEAFNQQIAIAERNLAMAQTALQNIRGGAAYNKMLLDALPPVEEAPEKKAAEVETPPAT